MRDTEREAKMKTELAEKREVRKGKCESVGSLEGLWRRRKELTEKGRWKRRGRRRKGGIHLRGVSRYGGYR